jgi:hypothetical protein
VGKVIPDPYCCAICPYQPVRSCHTYFCAQPQRKNAVRAFAKDRIEITKWRLGLKCGAYQLERWECRGQSNVSSSLRGMGETRSARSPGRDDSSASLGVSWTDGTGTFTKADSRLSIAVKANSPLNLSVVLFSQCASPVCPRNHETHSSPTFAGARHCRWWLLHLSPKPVGR